MGQSKRQWLKTRGSGSLKDNIITVFGISTFTCLEPVSLFISDDCKVDGFLSKPAYGSGRSLGDRQYYFVNGRPVDMPKVSKLVNELYRSANSKQYPIAIMNFVVPTRFCDVNVTPDKRKIFFSDEGSILKSLKEALVKIYSPHLASFSVQRYEELSQEENDSKACSHKNKPFPQFSLKPVSPGDSDSERVVYGEKKLAEVSNSVNEGEEALRLSPAVKSNKDGDYSTSKRDFTLKFHGMKKADTFACGSPSYNSTMQKSITEGAGSPQSAGAVQSLLTNFVTVNKRKHENNSNTLSEIPVLRNGPTLRQPVNKFFHLHSSAKSHIVVDDEADKIESKLSNHTTMDEHYDELDASPSKAIKISGQVEEDIMMMDKPAPVAKSVLDALSPNIINDAPEGIDLSTPPRSSQPDLDEPVPSSGSNMCYTVRFSFEELKKRRQKKLQVSQASKNTLGKSKTKGSLLHCCNT